MAKYLLFSEPQSNILNKMIPELFIRPNMKIAYMPSDGANANNPKYETFWKSYIQSNSATMIPINNSLRAIDAENEAQKLKNSDALILTGGNTFQFLHHLSESGLDKVIIDYVKKDKIIAGFSAGAMILSPTIKIAKLRGLDKNLVRIKGLSGLNLIDFEIYPHYEESRHKLIVDEYEQKTGRTVRRLTNEDLIIVD